ncbi:MAG: putative pirin [Betaproteobacteria bacterium]|nr:putative pirin [Betaproteobacteria bacterium]
MSALTLTERGTTTERRPSVAVRRVVHRTRGSRHGPITRLVSPSDLGELIKPFVFLDHFDMQPTGSSQFGIHPHSGIATFTLLLSGSVAYEDTTGKSGVLPAGGLEWMRAGGGVWHDGRPADLSRMHGLQLWVALPPDLENASPESQYVAPEDVPQDGPVSVALGRHGGTCSPVRAPASINYLHVKLQDGEQWRYEPPPGHTVAWVFAYAGHIDGPEPVATGELAVFEESNGPLEFVSRGDSGFVLGSAIKHPHDLALGYYSVHTSAKALERGEAEIQRIGMRLRAEGRLK